MLFWLVKGGRLLIGIVACSDGMPEQDSDRALLSGIVLAKEDGSLGTLGSACATGRAPSDSFAVVELATRRPIGGPVNEGWPVEQSPKGLT